jgi:hypothetical protein
VSDDEAAPDEVPVTTHPRAMATAIWQLRDAWAATARAGKRRQENARAWALGLSMFGAAIGSSSTLVDDKDKLTLQLLGLVSAVALAVAGYTAKEMLSNDRESAWFRARIAAEALQREVWFYLMGVSPYDKPDAELALELRSARLVANMGLNRHSVDLGAEPEKVLPKVAGIDGYLEHRVNKQLRYYEAAAAKKRDETRRWHGASFGIGVIGVLLGVIGTVFPAALAFVSLGTTVAGAVATWVQSTRAGALAELYQGTATQLLLLRARWKDLAPQREKLDDADIRARIVKFVSQCEDVIARESEAWRAEWASEEQGEAESEDGRVDEEPAPKPGASRLPPSPESTRRQ